MMSQEGTLFMFCFCFFLFNTEITRNEAQELEWRKMSAWWRHNLTEMLWMKQTTAEEPGRVQCPGLELGMWGCVVWHLSSAGDNCSHGRICGINFGLLSLLIICGQPKKEWRIIFIQKANPKKIKWWPQSLQLNGRKCFSCPRCPHECRQECRHWGQASVLYTAPPSSRVLTIAQWPH